MYAIKAYDIFKKNYSDEDAQDLIDYFESTPKDVATKSDLNEVKSDLKELKSDLKTDIVNLELKLIKWVIGTGIGTVTVIAGLLKFMLK